MMSDPREVAEQVLGRVEWQDAVSGFCQCPGQALHTQPSKDTDCRVTVDGAPTVYCFHASCANAVAQANRQLRRVLAHGHFVPGHLPQSRFARRYRAHRPLPHGHRVSPVLDRQELAALQASAERFKPKLFEQFAWPLADMADESPLQLAECEPIGHFRAWLTLWPPQAIVWIGDVCSSGRPEHCAHFRLAWEWYQSGPPLANYTCGAIFQPGSYRRSNETVAERRFLIVESDTLSRDQVGAVFNYLYRHLHLRLHCIIDTAGKSLHGWFDVPPTPESIAHLKVCLTVIGCDPKMFTCSQPVRVPGAFRDGRLQRIVWRRL